MPEDEKPNSGSAEQDIIEEAMERFTLAAEADASWRVECLDDLEFSIGNQWPLNIKTQRESKNKPCLVMDQIQQSVRLTCNEYRQQRPAITVDPVGSDADVDTAEILQGTVRHIEVISDAEIAYDGAHESVVRAGLGSFRILSDYDPVTDDLEIYIKPIRNQFSVYWQPGVPHHEAKWCFLVADVPNDTYDSDVRQEGGQDTSALQAIGNAPPDWITKEYTRVAEYFTVEEKKVKGRNRPKREVKWRKINAFEIIEGGIAGKDIPGSSIPILTAYGDDLDVNGQRHIAGLVRNAKGPQRMYNFFCSAATQTIALAPVAPVVAVEGSLAGYEKLWERANTGDVNVLYYKQIDVAGKPAPPPSRDTVEPPIQAMQAMVQQAAMDLRAATGLYDPSLGQRKGDESGKAIERLQSQGDVATFNYSDNMAREMRRCGRLLLEWIRAIYTEPKVQRIIKPDGSVSQVVIHNGPDQAEAAKALAAKQKQQIGKIYDIGVGQYDVVVEVGPSYKTKRQEAVATQLDFLKMMPPEISSKFLDLVTANMDWPQAQEYAKRAKKLLPPGLADDDPNDPQTQLTNLQAQNAQLNQQAQQATQLLQQAHQIIQTKQVEQQGKLEIAKTQELSKQTIVRMQEATKLAVAQINASKDANQSFAEAEIQKYEIMHDAAHDVAMAADQQDHEKAMAANAAANAQQSQQSDQAHQSDMAAQAQENQPEEATA